VKVADRVFMGSRATVIPGKKVGARSIVGAGAVVVADVPPGVTVVGNPARVL
jgi:acetyltransferase-like isoleucine patch superfamily enzyme